MKNKKIIDILILILIIIFFASDILIRPIGNLDELWNYNFARNITNGLIPYRDFNIITTPLLPIITGIILSLLGNELMVIRVLNILLNSLIIFMMYKIMNRLQIKSFLTYVVLFTMCYVFKQYAMFDYNFAVTLVSLIIIYIEIKNYENTKKSYQIIIGILAGICILLKQTTGLIISIALLGYKIIEVKNKNEFKEFFKVLMYRILGVIIPVLIMTVYLVINNALMDFIDYCILGVGTFSNKISYITRLIQNDNVLVRIFSLVPISLLVMLAMYLKNKDKNLLILFTFGIVGLVVVFPISDETHLYAGICVNTIGLAYILNPLIKRKILVFEIVCYLCMILFIIYQFIGGVNKYIDSNKNTQIPHYIGIIMQERKVNNILEMSEYIKENEKKVYILDSSAAYYMIPTDRYNKNYDMFCIGNLGSKGENGQIENIRQEQGNIKLLIKGDAKARNWQTPEGVINWITDNLNKTGQIGGFDIYE